ncbi:MAG: oligosaccharide flippase family protein [Clostridia bacterium]|nr:oligosaccharide flippase family protein [Clostridia bacterium]
MNRLLGFAYRVGLARAVGAEGLGLVQRAFPVYLAFLTVATLGLATGTAKLVADRLAQGDRAGAERVRETATWLVLPPVLLATAALLAFASPLSRALFGDARVAGPLLALAPALAASGLSTVLRGYFQGRERMTPIASGQVAEQAARVLCVYLLLGPVRPQDEAWLPTLAALCTTVGEWVGLGALAASFRRGRGRGLASPAAAPRPGETRVLAADLLGLSWPVALAHLVGSLNATIDAWLIPARLMASGLSVAAATAAFGQLVGMALPVVFLATVVVHPLANTLVPEIAEAAALGRRRALRRRAALALAATLAVGLLTSAALALFPAALGRALYGAPEIAPLLRVLAFAAPLMYLHQTGASILSGLGRTFDAMAIGLVATSLRVALLWLLAGLPGLGLPGAAAAIGAAHVAAGLLTWARILALFAAPR